jgi:hypothetical protein
MSDKTGGNLVLAYASSPRPLSSFLRANHAAAWFMSGVFFAAISGAGLTALASNRLGDDGLDAALMLLMIVIPLTAASFLIVMLFAWIRQLIGGGAFIEQTHVWIWGAAYAAFYDGLTLWAILHDLFHVGAPIGLLAAGILLPGALMGWFLVRRPLCVHLLSTVQNGTLTVDN